MEDVVLIVSCILSVLISTLLGKRHAEEFIELLKGLGIAASIVGVITAIASFIDTYTWATPTTISTIDQFGQFVINVIQMPMVFALNWFLNTLISLPSGTLSYIVAYAATMLREQIAYQAMY